MQRQVIDIEQSFKYSWAEIAVAMTSCMDLLGYAPGTGRHEEQDAWPQVPGGGHACSSHTANH